MARQPTKGGRAVRQERCMSKINVCVSAFAVEERVLDDAAKTIADSLGNAEPSADSVRAALDLPTWVGVPAELIQAVRYELLERPRVRRLGDYCPS